MTLDARTFKPNDSSGLIEYRSTAEPLVSLFLRYRNGTFGTLYTIEKGLNGSKELLRIWVPFAEKLYAPYAKITGIRVP